MIRVLAIVFIGLCGCGPAVIAQTSRRDPSDTLKQLLAMPAPRPPYDFVREVIQSRPQNFYAEDNPPSDDAPSEDLIAYWSHHAHQLNRLPSDAVRQRLLEVLITDPQVLASLIHLVPHTEAAAAKVKEVYDESLNNEKFEPYQRERIKGWLLYNSTFFLDELVALANKAKDDEESGLITKQAVVVALARLNWEVAEPILRGFVASAQPRLSTLALSLFYRRAIEQNESGAEDRYRNQLKAIAADRNQPGYARYIAIDNLSLTTWSGKDEWYLGLFHDETLLWAVDGKSGTSPLTTLFQSNPEKWIPILVRLLDSKDLAVRSAAANCLMSHQFSNRRKDVLLPLLPWIMNHGWIKDEFGYRQRLIQNVSFTEVPESVPSLIWVLENSDPDDGYDRRYAALSLAKYKDVRAGPTLKKALAKEKDEYHRTAIIESLIACNGLTDAEQVEALEAYATKLTTPEGRAEVEQYRSGQRFSVAVSIGRYLRELKVAPESLAQVVLIRAESLKSTNPLVARFLIEISHRWQSRQVDLDRINRISNGSADANVTKEALDRRESLRKTLGPELHALSSATGAAQGIAVALLEDPSLVQGVLGSQDQFAQIALLACSRLTRTSLPVDLIGPLLSSNNSLLSLAAKNYLLLEDSKEAREFLWKHHPNQAFVTGWREEFAGERRDFGIGEQEEKLRAEILKENGPVEIIALISSGEFFQVIRVYSDKIVYTHHEDSSRYRERSVSGAELSSLKDFITLKGLTDFGPQYQLCSHGCPAFEFFTVTKEKGRRVYTQRVVGDWEELKARFAQFSEKPDTKIHYNLEKEIKGLEVLFAEKDLLVKEIWKQGDEIRMFVERAATQEENEQYYAPVQADQDDEAAVNAERWQRNIAMNKAVYSWRLYTNNKAGEATSEPGIFRTIDESKFPPHEHDDSTLNDQQKVKLTSDSIVIARNTEGLWKQVAGSKPVRIASEGAYKDPIVTPDGRWVVVAKGTDNSNDPNYIARFDLRTGREFRVNLELADDFSPVAFVPPHGKVLLRRAQDGSKIPVGPERPEHYLLDPASGDTRLVSGDFEPLDQRGRRFLQPTEKPNEYWVALPDEDKNQTRLGRYNLKDFTFKTIMTIPHIAFDSMSMWVDEKQQKIYLVYKDQLLSLPLVAATQ